jgi:hypothetical protein
MARVVCFCQPVAFLVLGLVLLHQVGKALS